MIKQKINIQGIKISLFSENADDYFLLSDIAKYKNKERTDHIIQN